MSFRKGMPVAVPLDLVAMEKKERKRERERERERERVKIWFIDFPVKHKQQMQINYKDERKTQN